MIEIVEKINELLYSFIWNSPVCRVKKEILQNNYDNGGLKIINLNAFILSLKSTWIRRLFQKDNKWQHIFVSFIDTDKFYYCGSDYMYIQVNSKFLQFHFLDLVKREKWQNKSLYYYYSPYDCKISLRPLFYQLQFPCM
jgi:hypothetical protein